MTLTAINTWAQNRGVELDPEVITAITRDLPGFCKALHDVAPEEYERVIQTTGGKAGVAGGGNAV